MVDLTSVILADRSSLWETGVGNLPAVNESQYFCSRGLILESIKRALTLGKTRTQETGDLLDQRVGSDESVVLASQLLDELLVLVELLQVLGGHGVNTAVLRTVNVVLVTENADAHVRAGNLGELDGAGETLVTLRVVVLEADLELDGLEEVALLLLVAVLEQLLHVRTHASDRDLRHDGGGLPIISLRVSIGTAWRRLVVAEEKGIVDVVAR